MITATNLKAGFNAALITMSENTSTDTNTGSNENIGSNMLKHAKGNLIDMAANGDFNIIMHGCNCHNTMGSGIAREVRERYPAAFAADSMTVKGDRSKLGTVTLVEVDNDVGGAMIIVNAYTQYDFNRAGQSNDVFEYDAFQKILNAFAHDAGPNMQIGLPYIGMGLAGGNKQRIMGMIEDFAQKVSAKGGSVTLVEFS